MNNTEYYPPVSFYFSVSIMGEEMAFQEVSGISKQLGYEEIAGGGENRFKHKLPTVTTNTNLILKRGLVLANSALVAWCRNVLEGSFAKPVITHDVAVNLLGADGMVQAKWLFMQAYPVGWQLSDLHSQKSELAIEKLELAYTYFTAIDIK